jgi:hypothetical protein
MDEARRPLHAVWTYTITSPVTIMLGYIMSHFMVSSFVFVMTELKEIDSTCILHEIGLIQCSKK